MKLKFNEFEIDILPFVQLCGMNCKKKEFIINSIEKHFSSGKYIILKPIRYKTERILFVIFK